jgi:dGTP triphosphohydrolase
MARPKKHIINLSNDEIKLLKTTAKQKITSVTITKRCKVLLALDENNPKHLTHEQIANLHDVSEATVANIITDYISGMTDSYAVNLYKELTGYKLP